MVHAEVGNTESTPVSVLCLCVCVSVSFVCVCILCVILLVHQSVCYGMIVFLLIIFLGLKMWNIHVLVLFPGWNIFKLVPTQPLDPDVIWNFGRLKNKKHVERLKIWTSNFGTLIDWWLGTEIRYWKFVGLSELFTPVCLSLDSYGCCQLSLGLGWALQQERRKY